MPQYVSRTGFGTGGVQIYIKEETPMRNLKKVLVLVLCLAMMLSIMVVGAGAVFTDAKDIDSKHQEAVDMSVALNIVQGYPDGSFQPNGNVTRAEMAKIICIALNGGKEPATSVKPTPTFADIDGHWAEGFIEYCYAKGVVAGKSADTFDPSGNVTGSEAAKMLLVALGYNQDVERYVGSDWALYVNVQANQDGLYKELLDIETAEPLTREHAAQMIWNALQAYVINKSSQIDRTTGDITDVYTKDDGPLGTDMLKKYYDANNEIGYMTAISYDSNKGQYTYTFSAGPEFGGDSIPAEDAISVGSVKTAADFSDLFGQKVKVVYKSDDTSNVFGIYPYESNVLHEGIVSELPKMDDGSVKSVKIDGTTYSLDETRAATPVYAYNVAGVDGYLAGYESGNTEFYNYCLIDNDDDGKANCMVVRPVVIGTFTYMVGDKFTAKNAFETKTYKLDDVNMYEGAAKDDYYVMVPAANTVDDTDTYTKLDSVISGKATAKSSTGYTVDGVSYDFAVPLIPGSATKVDAGDTIKEAAVYNGFAFYTDKDSSVSAQDYVLVTGYKPADTLDSKVAELLFTDGTTQRVTLDKGNDTDKAANKAKYNAIDASSIGKLFTYEVDKDKYTLTPAINDQSKNTNEESGFKQVITGAYKYDKDLKSTIGTSRIDPNAIVFVNDAGDYSVITGEKLAKINDTIAVNNAYANKNDSTGYTAVMLASVKATVSSDDNTYGYVVSDVSTVKNDANETVLSFDLFNGTETVTVTSVKSDVTPYGGMAKGTVIKYAPDGSAIDIKAQYNVNSAAALSAITAYNGSDEFSYVSGAVSETISGVPKDVINKAGTPMANVEINKDTVILCIDNDEIEGIPGGVLDLATETPAGNYYANAFVIYNSTDKDADLIVFCSDMLNVM